jgi:hypothetical protein
MSWCLQVAVPRSRLPLKVQNLRVNNVEIPNSKKVEISLQYIYGIGSTTAKAILVNTVSLAAAAAAAAAIAEWREQKLLDRHSSRYCTGLAAVQLKSMRVEYRSSSDKPGCVRARLVCTAWTTSNLCSSAGRVPAAHLTCLLAVGRTVLSCPGAVPLHKLCDTTAYACSATLLSNMQMAVSAQACYCHLL